MRLFPEITPENKAFWHGGEHRKLLIAHCDACNLSIHPPQIACPRCFSSRVSLRPAKGTGVIYSYTINRHQWAPDMDVPFALAIVELDGEPGVRLTARLIEFDLSYVAIGARVEVDFEHEGSVWFPVFRPLR